MLMVCIPFFCNDPASTDIYTLSLHDALPICLWQLWGLAVPPFLRMIATSRLYRACVSCSWLLAVGDPGCCGRSEEHTSELQSLRHLVCRVLLEKKKTDCLAECDRISC